MGRLGDDPPDEALHKVRIYAKGLRYAAEAVKPVSDRLSIVNHAFLLTICRLLGITTPISWSSEYRTRSGPNEAKRSQISLSLSPGISRPRRSSIARERSSPCKVLEEPTHTS